MPSLTIGDTIRAMKTKLVLAITLVLLVFTLSSCLPGDGTADLENPANFLWGVWHGWMAPLSLIIHLFRDNIRIYEGFNIGWWYDFGYYIAIVGGFGGISLSRKRGRKRRDRDEE